ncbi:hypothetical protein G5B30_12380 [Sphingobacterium sp. SGG-5]|uniref:hypothetical protein n=1 Tax=Sphingobacterium sp. SGG-5 TaxID=2710881 RepID=UPI0013E9D0ED|nr:hypothetical protein [Sphingobacterium sp. SGG-5]NGM62711.1 hypothetical protein [Sphingobacterium sp. SGG-5]
MKNIFLALVLLCTLNVYGQQQSVFIELGGSFQKTQSTSDFPSSGHTIAKEPKIIARLGYAISAHSLLGLAYKWSNEKTSYKSILINDLYRKIDQSDVARASNTYGLFYRYYFIPLGEKRWNVFADFNPGYFWEQQDEKTASSAAYNQGDLDQYVSMSGSRSMVKWSGLDIDLGAGISYRLVHGLSAQLSLRSIANVKHFRDSRLVEEDNQSTFVEIFNQPLSNTYLSLTYQF